jgi:hypothetical protein
LLLSHNGSDNYWWGSKVASNYCSTPYNASKTFVDDFEIIAYDINPFLYASDNNIIGKFTGITTRQFIFGITATGGLYLGVSIDGINTISYLSTANIPTAGNTFSVKITRDKINGLVKFFTSIDSGANFTQLGANVSSITSSLFNANTDLLIGAYLGGSGGNFGGKIKRVTIANSIGGTPVVDFNPATYNASTSQTQWTSATGEVWTINTGTATSGYKGVLVDRTMVQSDGVDDNLNNLTINQLSPFTYNLSFRQFQLTAGTGSGVLGRGTSRVAMGAGNFNTKTNTIWTWAPSQLSTYGGANDMDKNLNLFQSIIPSMTETGWTMRKNNSNYGSVGETSGTPVDGGGVYLFYSGNGAEYSNSIINTVVISNNAQVTAQSTATYNLIRSLNNNAF